MLALAGGFRLIADDLIQSFREDVGDEDVVDLHFPENTVEEGHFAVRENGLKLLRNVETLGHDVLELIVGELLGYDLQGLGEVVDSNFQQVEQFFIIGQQL